MFQKKQFQKAAAIYAPLCNVADLLSNSATGYCYRYAWYLAQASRWKKAEGVLDAILSAQAQSASAHKLMGYVLLNQGRLQLSAWHSLQALRLSPNDSIALANLSRALARQGMHQKAESLLQKALRKAEKSDKARLYYFLARSQAAQHKMQKALFSITQARKEKSGTNLYKCLHGELLFENKMYKQAIPLLEQCLKKHSNRNTALFALLGSLIQTGRWKEAHKTGRLLLRRGYKQKALPALLAASLQTQKYRECGRYAAELRKIRSDYPGLDYQEAVCLAHLGKYALALPLYKKAIEKRKKEERQHGNGRSKDSRAKKSEIPPSKALSEGLYFNTGVALEHLNRAEEALPFYKEGCRQGDKKACREWSRLASQSGRENE